MNWIDIASIVFVCVTMNHLGLISAIESAIHRKLWIVDCPKCAAFWATLGWCCVTNATEGTVQVLAVSFLASYMAIWLELFEGFVDSFYARIYEKIYTNTDDDADSAVPDKGYSAGSVSELQPSRRKSGGHNDIKN